jgi:hypothetical protein
MKKRKKEPVNYSGTIRISELESGDLLLLDGEKFMAREIAKAQRRKFKGSGFSELNHVGIIMIDQDENIIIYEQDGAGKFGTSFLLDEYINVGSVVYIGRFNQKPSVRQIVDIRLAVKKYASDDSVLNYSYKWIINFWINSKFNKWFNKDFWLFKKKPKGTTCSQITAKIFQENTQFFAYPEWQFWYPCMFAMDENITVKKLIS